MNPCFPPALESLIRMAVSRDASDLHLIPGEPPALRLRGVLERMEADELSPETTREWAAALIGEANLARIGTEIGEFQRSCDRQGEFNLSVAVARSRGDYTLAFRVMLPDIPSAKDIAIPEAVIQAAQTRTGLIVFAGLAGSGKTTTLYSVADHLNATAPPLHIVTVESPTHLYITPKKALIQQREVGLDIPSRLAGIEAASVQDPDVLLVGDITTVEELQACITVAETGHLVLTQLHAASPENAINRMIEVFPEENRFAARRSLAQALRAVCAQRLLPSATGRGRVAAYGVLVPDDEMRAALAAGDDFMIRKSPWPQTCSTIAQDIERLRLTGAITEDTADGPASC